MIWAGMTEQQVINRLRAYVGGRTEAEYIKLSNMASDTGIPPGTIVDIFTFTLPGTSEGPYGYNRQELITILEKSA